MDKNINKITLNGEVKIDLTQDTAVEEDVLEGKTFHKADGSIGIGTAAPGGGDNTVIDIVELPTENVDPTKIYRVLGQGEPIIYLVYPDEQYSINDLFQTLSQQTGLTFSAKCYLVDAIPTSMEASTTTETSVSYHIYVLKETGMPFISLDGTSVVDFGVSMEADRCVGWVDSVDDVIPPSGNENFLIYTLHGDASTIYGIPDTEDSKSVFEYTSDGVWKELGTAVPGGGNEDQSGIVDVTELPTTGIDENLVYRLSELKDFGVWLIPSGDASPTSLKNAVKTLGITTNITYYDVDELPASPNVSNLAAFNPLHCYVYNDVPYVYGNAGAGNQWIPVSMLVSQSMSCPTEEKGSVDNVDLIPNRADEDKGQNIWLYVVRQYDIKYCVYSNGEWKEYEVSDIVDVDSLPDHATVDMNKVYRFPVTNGKLVCNDSSLGLLSFESLMGMLLGQTPVCRYIIVDELPEQPLVSDYNGICFVYLMSTTGDAYLSTDGTTYASSAELLGSTKGWVDSYNEITEYGAYAVRSQGTCYAFPKYEANAYIGMLRVSGGWVDFVSLIGNVQTLKSQNDTLTAENTSLNTEKETLTAEKATLIAEKEALTAEVAKIDEYRASANFTDYVVISGYADGIEIIDVKNSTIQHVRIPEGITKIGDSAFYGCDLVNILIPKGIVSIGSQAFASSKINDVTFEGSSQLTVIGPSAFSGCTRLNSIMIPNGVTAIEEFTFNGCDRLSIVAIPVSVTHIGNRAFSGYPYSFRITYLGTKAQWKAIDKDTMWDYSLDDYTITCTDGTIAKDGTET